MFIYYSQHCLICLPAWRLGLERAVSAENAADIVSELVTSHGLAGHVDGAWPLVTISMLICDRSEAWILEAAGKHMAALRIRSMILDVK